VLEYDTTYSLRIVFVFNNLSPKWPKSSFNSNITHRLQRLAQLYCTVYSRARTVTTCPQRRIIRVNDGGDKINLMPLCRIIRHYLLVLKICWRNDAVLKIWKLWLWGQLPTLPLVKNGSARPLFCIWLLHVLPARIFDVKPYSKIE